MNKAPEDLVVLGSTGSIGTQTLEVVRLFAGRFRIRALTAHSNIDELERQAREFVPDCVVVEDEAGWERLRETLSDTPIRVLSGTEGLCEVASLEGVDTVVAAIVGVCGLDSVVAAIRAGHRVALANKETLVVAGSLVRSLIEENNSEIIPIDSEHSAIFQCLVGEPDNSVERLLLTASGGPFRTLVGDRFEHITPAEALDHPNWSMGAKVTIDSATMMNKGLEVIEARWLFDLTPDKIQVVVHPQSIIHSMVTFHDGSTKAQLGPPDMRVPIQYALTYPERWPAPHPRIDWRELRSLEFEEPDLERFPCLSLAFHAVESGGSAPAVLNAANEEAVAMFLREEIRFTEIPRLIEHALEVVPDHGADTLEALMRADASARRAVQELSTASAY